MKVFLHFEDTLEDDLKMTIKLTLPKSWRSGPVQRLIGTFVEAYNKKHPESALDEDAVHFEKSDGFVAPFDAPVNSFLESGGELFLKNGASQSMEALGFEPPSSEAESPAAEASDDATKASSSSSAAATTNAKTDSGSKPKGVSSVAAARAAADAKLAAKNKAEGKGGGSSASDRAGKLHCEHFGCNAWYAESENNETACKYHAKPPVFHDLRKFYSCCPEKVGWDWDSFEAIEGCCVGPHTTEKQGKQMFLGGTDVRAEAAGGTITEGAPQRIFTGFDKLSATRKTLADIGVPGSAFDAARDALKAKHESGSGEDADKVWDAVSADLGKVITTALEGVASAK
ncbi:Cysteine and histidine-rich domain-containing protein 1 [Hondaea fermentalgiana]|uniref:Cysteine and histidine-rich domain-containing protein 1 n=1 Tax=Hondaea fermentalgiana TaxID=2315210 RepID=A0A2R5GRD9_9STRA|nr:Cysteine and histidine-rich domain-containing protein 1 [Hondaea fermentalgiana]|eukprot:GBG32328.1 Cysteine and histidine-rich domain-containing protein 1 [Hondaea fermentalgiana]